MVKSTILQPKTNFKGGSIKWYRKLKTPYESLDIFQFMEYLEAEESMEHMDIMENKARQMAERKKESLQRNPLYKLACVLGLF